MKESDTEELVAKITIVIATPTHHVFACGPYRSECSQISTRWWSCRVWHVIGPVELCRTTQNGVNRAKAECIKLLFGACYGDESERDKLFANSDAPCPCGSGKKFKGCCMGGGR